MSRTELETRAGVEQDPLRRVADLASRSRTGPPPAHRLYRFTCRMARDRDQISIRPTVEEVPGGPARGTGALTGRIPTDGDGAKE